MNSKELRAASKAASANGKLLQQLREVELPEDVLAELEGVKPEVDVVEVEVDPSLDEDEDVSAEITSAIATTAASTPEVRTYRTLGKYLDDEIKVVAAALRTRTALYRVADSLHCSYTRIKNMINAIPVLKELATEQRDREREETEEAVDDCIKARVPAVVMWKASKILPEKYGEQVNMDNEDDTRLVIGGIPEDQVAAADTIVKEMENKVPDVGKTLLDDMKTGDAVADGEIAAEVVAGGADASIDALANTPAAPAVSPPTGDPNFGAFISASDMTRVESIPPDMGQDNYGVFQDDYGADSWI